MLAQSSNLSVCQYLFLDHADDVYTNFNSCTKEEVDTHFMTLMKVNRLFLSRDENDGFCFIDPLAFNNQCHLYAFFAYKIRAIYKEKSEEEKLEQTEDNRFLDLSFLLSSTFVADRSLFNRVIEKVTRDTKDPFPVDESSLKKFMKNLGSEVVIKSARLSLNHLFEERIKRLFFGAQDKSPLHQEFYNISLEKLSLPVCQGASYSLYTLPKIVGVAYILEEGFPFVIKTKVVSPSGSSEIIVMDKGSQNQDDPVVVFEAITSESDSIEKIITLAKRCPSFFHRHPSKKNRHLEGEKCFFCLPASIEEGKYQERFEKVRGSVEESFMALAADFIVKCQPEFLPFFKDQEKYPLLSALFERGVNAIEPLGLSADKPRTFAVHHAFLDDKKHALSTKLRISSSQEQLLQERGYL